ncbi:DUF4172 domain-containing protein [Candidatus Woesearchaeota archaeon]|nr:DUF4172 domain-containing protein [Candidatus Woesearchaeota archaeon]
MTLESKLLLDEALSSAKIEGEILDRDSVRSTVNVPFVFFLIISPAPECRKPLCP